MFDATTLFHGTFARILIFSLRQRTVFTASQPITRPTFAAITRAQMRPCAISRMDALHHARTVYVLAPVSYGNVAVQSNDSVSNYSIIYVYFNVKNQYSNISLVYARQSPNVNNVTTRKVYFDVIPTGSGKLPTWHKPASSAAQAKKKNNTHRILMDCFIYNA